MATSRTGTSKWLKLTAQRRQQDQANGVTTCPLCGVWLNWEHSRQPNSPETDHIIPHSKGGRDELENTRSICRHCNQSRGVGNSKPKNKTGRVPEIRFTTTQDW